MAKTGSGSVNGEAAGPTQLATSHGPLATAYSRFRNRIMFPICNESGKVIAFTGRTLSTDEKSGPKYLNSPETPIYSKSRVLFNLDKAKEWIRKLDYAILVEGQMDCISVYNAGFQNVIASSGTAFTEVQAKLLSRFNKNIIVNFDPDTAGAAAAERSLAVLISEDFQIKVLTLEAGLDPDLYIRRKGRDAYAQALRQSQKYFEYLVERARSLFPVRTPEGKVKALNYLLPHIQRVPSRIVRDEWANEISHRLGIASDVLRQELRHAASTRSASKVSAGGAGRLTDAERVLIRALASDVISPGAGSDRAGQDGEFDPARQAHFVLTGERLHEGSAAEALFEAMLAGQEQGLDPMSLPLEEAERAVLASVLMDEHEELTPELLENATHSLRKKRRQQELEQLQHRVKELEGKEDVMSRAQLAQERLRLKQAIHTFRDVTASD